MTVILKNRVRDNTSSTGTGTITLDNNPPAGYQSFSVVGNLNETYYQIVNSTGSEWEVGRGIYTASGTTLSRDLVFSSSNSSNKVNFSAGTKTVVLVYPAALHAPGVEPADKRIIASDRDAERKKHLYVSSLEEGIIGETALSIPIVSTFSLVLTTGSAYHGGVLAPNGDIHFVPLAATRGQRINPVTGVVSTYSLVYTTAAAYRGGVLAPNGDIHFVPFNANRGQKVSASGVVSTYSLVNSATTDKYIGGVLAPNGHIHFVPFIGGSTNRVGQAVDTLTGIAYTYSFVDLSTITSGNYWGGVLAPNGEIHFVPRSQSIGQKLDTNTGVVSTYSLVHTAIGAYAGGVLAQNGDIHFVASSANVGQKVNYITGAVSTYSLVLTGTSAYAGGVLAPNGDIHFVPFLASRGQKISATGVVSTYSLTFTVSSAYNGGVLAPNGDIILINASATRGQRLSTLAGNPFPLHFTLSPYLNKY